MKVICKQITSEKFDLNEIKTVLSNEFDYSYGGYGLELNREYLVMGILIYKNSKCIYYLIDVFGKPDWFPYLLFDITDNVIPENWCIKISNNDIHMLCGFDELCNNSDFYNKLLDRDDKTMQVYFKRKIELEKSSQDIYL